MNKLFFPCILIAATLNGCASPARIDQMTARQVPFGNIEAAKPLKNEISVNNVNGGESTNPLWISNIGTNDFKQALEKSLDNSTLLAKNESKGKYSLNANLISIEKPLFGLDMTVTATIEYTLEEVSTNKVIFSKTIITPFTATVSDAFMGVERLKIANEGAARKNIEGLINDLLELKIDKEQISLKN
jgi:hypothetical protein